jgi:hypothetical protein
VALRVRVENFGQIRWSILIDARFCRVTEVQVFLFELVSRLKFEPADKTGRIRRENCLIMLPMVEGEEEKGNKLPLKISVIDDHHSDGEWDM